LIEDFGDTFPFVYVGDVTKVIELLSLINRHISVFIISTLKEAGIAAYIRMMFNSIRNMWIGKKQIRIFYFKTSVA
jgi:hypothetical protein